MPSKEGTNDKPREKWEILNLSQGRSGKFSVLAVITGKKMQRGEVLDGGSWEELDSPD